MNRLKMAALAGLMTVGAAAPALADYVTLGSVDVGYRTDRTPAYTRFGGRLEGLRLVAKNPDMATATARKWPRHAPRLTSNLVSRSRESGRECATASKYAHTSVRCRIMIGMFSCV